MLAESANRTKKGGQELIGGLDVRVNRNHFGRQIESFQTDIYLPFLADVEDLPAGPFPGIFIRAPVVERILPHVEGVQKQEQQMEETVVAPSKAPKDDRAKKAMAGEVKVMASLPGRLKKVGDVGLDTLATEEDIGDIVAVKQGNVFGTSFHPELTADIRIHVWWLTQVLQSISS